ncbi:metallo-beta-lactamase family protein [Plasmopara halstedii]|uniref:Metallo-beta-lactamase family protein n=1 Tax=Plasmopara halstedii TaxID=4781 RepID=A0A0P1AV82_PLAHL|nr:metallo-beta-lactamase family protein [Plasmopara halstedii]CEG44468.1 metallo-beta-lactamase family protein [Plasmopara halstedii]|eukprot:XP_024580837.1 metallo-beta-lactamase family protein [Plasmopara halstedii]
MEVVVLGCGPSSSVPSMRCVLSRTCGVCNEAHANPDSKNRRLNPSLLVRNIKADKNVLIDCGKTFREAALRIFPQVGISAVHSIVLTHDHADALLGIDDLREVQATVDTIDPVSKEVLKVPSIAMKVHCSEVTGREVIAKFPYLISDESSPSASDKGPKPFRWTAKLQIEAFTPWKPFEACGITFFPFPVIHGTGYTSFGFEFGLEVGARFVYISDVSEIPEETRKFLNDTSKPPVDVLLIDALYIDKYHSTHMNLQKVMDEIATFKPKRTLLTGMSHDFDYHIHSIELPKLGNEKGLNIEMTYDGLRIAFLLPNDIV